MIILRFGVLFLLIYAHYMRCDTHMSKLAKYVCTVTEKIANADKDATDVVIGRFNSKMPVEFLSEITKCISKHSMVITTDFSKLIDDKNLRIAKVVIIVSDEANPVGL